MKKYILTAVAALVLGTSVTFAHAAFTPVPDQIVKNLNQEFAHANNVIWKTTPNFYKASFTIAGHPLEAFYGFDGQLLGISRTIGLEQLPMNLIKSVKEKGTPSQVTELFELLTDRGTEYYITFRTANNQKTYKSSGDSWSSFDARTFNQNLY